MAKFDGKVDGDGDGDGFECRNQLHDKVYRARLSVFACICCTSLLPLFKKKTTAAVKETQGAEDEDEAEVPAICKELSNKAAQNELPKMPASISE